MPASGDIVILWRMFAFSLFRRQPETRSTVAAPQLDADVERRLRSERIVWLTTVGPDGRPFLAPVWFLWDGREVLILSKPHARKVRNVRRESRVMLAVGDPAADFDVQLIEGQARLGAIPARRILGDPQLGADHRRKYATAMAALGLGPEEFAETYSQVMRVQPARFLAWHGRSPRGSASARAVRATLAFG